LKPGRFPLIVDPLVETTQLTKALMDRDSGLNLLYLDTIEGLVLGRDLLKTTLHPFYEVVFGKQFIPLKQVNLHVTFGDASSYHTEMLHFEVVHFPRPYHIIVEWPYYVKFMAIHSHAYLKLKILGHALHVRHQ
jgi:hypothetical protein